MVREWANGRRGLSDFYAELLTRVFGVPFLIGRPDENNADDSATEATDSNVSLELAQRVTNAATVDNDLVLLLESQTQSLRMLDRRLGAARLLAQTESHLAQMRDLLMYSLPSQHRSALACAVAEAAALAGWQALDLGDPMKAWRHHETAKSAARESENASVLAHVTAQQAYALMDLDRADDALTLVQSARMTADGKVPALLRSWLYAAEAEAHAAKGSAADAHAALDHAAQELPTHAAGEELPFVVLDDVHLARWRGNCLARLGADEAIDDLTGALDRLDPSFARAAASLHCDLAVAHSVRGDHDEAREQAIKAQALADRTASERQNRRIRRLLAIAK